MRQLNQFLALVLLVCGAAQAAEGRIELSQTCAINIGCTSGDSSGFPISISQAGSYLLTSDLSVALTSTTAISVSADDVSIDLNGFSIAGPVVCSGGAPTCASSGTGSGIAASGVKGLAIRNGTVRGMGGNGITAGDGAVVDSVHVYSNGNMGLSLGDALVQHCVISDNGGIGLATLGLALDNRIRNNGGFGVFTFGPNLGYGNNVITENNPGGPQVSGGTQIATNLCGSSSINANTTCP